MTVARRAGARWGESSRPSAPLSARRQSTSRLVCGRVQKSPTRLSARRTPRPRAVRSRSHKPVETPPEDHRRPGRPGATGRGPPHEVGPDAPGRERGRPDRDEFARSRRRRAVLRACTPVGSRGRPRRSRVWGMLCGSAARARGPDGGAPACQVRANTARTPRHPRTRRRCAYARPTTAAIGYPRLCGYDYEAAMATWIEATRGLRRRGGRVRQRVAPARCDSEVRRSVTARCSSLGAPSLHADRALQHYARGTRLYFTDIPSRLYY